VGQRLESLHDELGVVTVQDRSQGCVFHWYVAGVVGGCFFGLRVPPVNGGTADSPQQVRPEHRLGAIAALHGGCDLEERILGDVLCVGFVGHEAPGEPQAGVVVSAVEGLQGAAVTRAAGTDKFLVRDFRVDDPAPQIAPAVDAPPVSLSQL
jgi:hypothetical protein